MQSPEAAFLFCLRWRTAWHDTGRTTHYIITRAVENHLSVQWQAQAAVDDAISEAPSGMALCIVHGMGTGRLRAALHDMLKDHTQVHFLFFRGEDFQLVPSFDCAPQPIHDMP